MQPKEFKYKLDFYYQQALIYLVTFILYAGVKGSFIENEFTFVFRDPILYIIGFFVVVAFVTLLLNRIRDRKLVVENDAIVFQHKFARREILFSSIEWLHIGREKAVQTAGRFQVIVFKVNGRRRLYRIRVGRYEREKELLAEMERVAARVPKGDGRRFRVGRKRSINS
ncbi:MAG TPA: hypothetical protein VMM58_07840 [Bacteroidota bacterium]|nr:hypothetical protein [Bacteroidota bacterium]